MIASTLLTLLFIPMIFEIFSKLSVKNFIFLNRVFLFAKLILKKEVRALSIKVKVKIALIFPKIMIMGTLKLMVIWMIFLLMRIKTRRVCVL